MSCHWQSHMETTFDIGEDLVLNNTFVEANIILTFFFGHRGQIKSGYFSSTGHIEHTFGMRGKVTIEHD